jgi:CubicO group peptidase (beta-lactamase class C family)
MTATPISSGRRAGLAGLAGLLAGGTGGCALDPVAPSSALSDPPGRPAANPQDFRLDHGVKRRDGGPDLARYADARGGFAQADALTWWRPEYSVDGFSRLADILPSRPSTPATAPRPVIRAAREPEIRYQGAGPRGAGQFDLDGYFERNPATGLLILREGQVLAERYQYGRDPGHRFTSFSMAKTCVALLAGLALADGRIRSLDDPAERYASGLKGREYGRTPLRHLLTMSSGVQFREDYDGRDDAAVLSRRAVGGQSAGGADVVRPFNRREAAPGQRWYYASSETFVLALVLREAFGRPLAEVFSERIWQAIGAATPAAWTLDRSGLELGYMGVHATLPDWGRLAAMLADRGRVEGREVIPAAWLEDMTRAHFTPRQTRRFYGYGYQTWTFPEADGSYALLGVRGQALYVWPARRLALVHTAVRIDARDAGGVDTYALWRSLKAAAST